jgi:hypothetical protein
MAVNTISALTRGLVSSRNWLNMPVFAPVATCVDMMKLTSLQQPLMGDRSNQRTAVSWRATALASDNCINMLPPGSLPIGNAAKASIHALPALTTPSPAGLITFPEQLSQSAMP